MRGRNLQNLNIIRHTSLNVFCTEAGALQRNKVLKKPLLRNTGALQHPTAEGGGTSVVNATFLEVFSTNPAAAKTLFSLSFVAARTVPTNKT